MRGGRRGAVRECDEKLWCVGRRRGRGGRGGGGGGGGGERSRRKKAWKRKRKRAGRDTGRDDRLGVIDINGSDVTNREPVTAVNVWHSDGAFYNAWQGHMWPTQYQTAEKKTVV
eukprot:1903513-Rhodomonas_salina.2